MAKKTQNFCPECGAPMRWEERQDQVTYKEHKRTVSLVAWWCSPCGEAIFDGKALAARERAFFELRAKVDGVLAPAQVTRVRKRLGLSQRSAGEILGGGPRAFQKYESGSVTVSAPMSNLLRLLANDPERLKELET